MALSEPTRGRGQEAVITAAARQSWTANTSLCWSLTASQDFQAAGTDPKLSLYPQGGSRPYGLVKCREEAVSACPAPVTHERTETTCKVTVQNFPIASAVNK